MREVNRSALIAQPQARIYELINDVESYPQFVPWCRSARIEARAPGEIVATLGVARGPLRAEFTTRNLLDPARSVRMQLVRGPFRTLEGLWTLVPIGDSGTRIELALRFEFESIFPSAIFDPVFEETAGALVDAFVRRARRADG